jgi:hypothetical protein
VLDEKMNHRFLLVVVLIIFLSFFVFSVSAQNQSPNEVEKYFETVRGELLQFYGSEMVSHAAVLLGLVVAFPSIGWRARRKVSYRDGYSRWGTFGFNWFYLFIFVSMVVLVFYFVGRTILWSSLSAQMVSATTSVGIDGSNLSASMGKLADYASNQLNGATWILKIFIIPARATDLFLQISAVLSLLVSLVGSIVITSYRRSR